MRTSPTVPVLLALALAILLPTAAAAQHDHECAGDVAEALRELGIGPDEIDRIFYTPVYSPNQRRGSRGVQAWIDLAACPGRHDLMISLDRRCHVRNTDFRGACSLAGEN